VTERRDDFVEDERYVAAVGLLVERR